MAAGVSPAREFVPPVATGTGYSFPMPTAAPQLDELRFSVPLYTLAEAARYLQVPESTISTWAHGYERHPPNRKPVYADAIITAVDAPRGEPRMPFVGLAEGQVVAALRRGLETQRVSLQRIRRAVEALREQIGLAHALASRALYTDGAELLYAYGEAEGGPELAGLTVLQSGQRVFRDIVRDYLTRITYGDDNYAARLVLPGREQLLEVDPRRGLGRPLIVGYGVPVDAVVGRLKAGEDLRDVAQDFDVPPKLLKRAVEQVAAG